MNIGKSVKIALAQQEKDTAWLAKRAKISRQSAWYHTVRREAKSQTIGKLAKIFGMTESAFIALGES